MKPFPQSFKKNVPVIVLLMLVVAGLLPIASASAPMHKIAVDVTENTPNVVRATQSNIVINEIHSYGSGNEEWVELYNPSSSPADYTDLKLTDQDGNTVNLSAIHDDNGNPILPLPANNYIVIYFGKGVNKTNYNKYTDPITGAQTGNATIHMGWNRNVLNDDGDDLLLYNGTYGTKNCEYLDYVVYSNGGPNSDIDQPPMGSNIYFKRDGTGYNGYAPAPGPDESISLVPNGDDTHSASSWYITRRIVSNGRYDNSMTPGMRNANILLIHTYDISPTNQTQGTEKAVIKYTLSAIGGNVGIYKTFVHVNGTIEDDELTSGLYLDNPSDPDGVWDTGDQMLTTGYATYSGHNTTFSTPNIYVSTMKPITLFITVKLSKNASIFHNYSLELVDMDTGMWPDNIHTNEVYFVNKIQTKYVKISPIDQVPPYVVNVHYDRKMPLGPGIHSVTITFDKPMDTRILPNVTYGIIGDEYTIHGKWESNTVWSGEFRISSSGPHGELTLLVKNAKDVAWNVMVPYQGKFYVDTQRPYVENIEYSSVPPYPAGFPVNITLTFSEPVSSPTAVIKEGKRIMVYAQVFPYNSTVYYVHFTTQASWRTGNYTLTVFNATDVAGNPMYTYSTNFVVDTSPPTISYIEFQTTAVEGQNVTFQIYATDNYKVKAVWAVYNYHGERVQVQATRAGGYWTFQVVGGAVVPGSTDVTIYVQDQAGNIFKDEETISVIPWWQAMWWLWVVLAIVIGFILYLVYDYVRRVKLREQLGEDMVPESIIVRVGKAVKRPAKQKKKKEKKEKKKSEEEEEEEEYVPPPAIEAPPSAPASPPVEESEEVPEVPYEEDYLNEETIERDE